MAGKGAYLDQTLEGKIKGCGTRRAVEWRLHKGCSSTRQGGVRAAREAKLMAALAHLRAVYVVVRWFLRVDVTVKQTSRVAFR